MSFWRALCLALLPVFALAAEVSNGTFPQRKTFQFGEFIIEASAGDEAYVEALALQLEDMKLDALPPEPAARLTLNDLADRKDHFLGLIAAQLALSAPTEQMVRVYDNTVSIWRYLPQAMPTRLPIRYALWRRPELVARLTAGQKIPGFALSGNDLTFSFAINIPSSPQTPEEVHEAVEKEWRDMVCPIKIGAESEKAPADEIRDNLSKTVFGAVNGFRSIVADTAKLRIFNVLHEATEAGIVWHYITSKDRRWFCDGVANYVAWRVIASEIGHDGARDYYNLAEELKKYAGMAGRVDLASWPAAENRGNYAEDLNTANYAFATKVIADVCAKEGDDLLPRWFAQIGRTPREKTNIATVFKAYRKVTDDDLRKYLPKPAKS